MPAKLRMTAKTSVDKPKIMARVAAMEKRSFQMLMMFLDRSCGAYNVFSKFRTFGLIGFGIVSSC